MNQSPYSDCGQSNEFSWTKWNIKLKSFAREYRWEVLAKDLKGAQEICLPIIFYSNKEFSQNIKDSVDLSDPSLSNDLVGICKDMLDWKYVLDHITERHKLSEMF